MKQPEELTLFASAMINGGMITQYDPKDIEDSQVTLAKNSVVRNTVTGRRPGHDFFTPEAPDVFKVLGLFEYKDYTGVVSLIRFTTDSVYIHGTVAWAEVTGAPLSTPENALLQFLVSDNECFFANGIDPLQQIDISGETYADAGNAPSYKYWCIANNRLVGFNRYDATTPNPIEVGWSGNLNLTEFSQAVDISAGNQSLITSPSDFADFGTGIFAIGEMVLAVRERSLWVGVVQPIATNPFYFYNVVPTMGCDTPKSIQKIPGGICYYDRRLKNVFTYKLNTDQPVPIGDGIRDAIRQMITNPDLVFSAYDYPNDEYSICIPIESSVTVRRWKYNFKSAELNPGKSAWEYDEIDNISSMSTLNYASGSISIDSLVGTIDSLIGDIDDLSPSIEQSSIFLGKTDGEILIENSLSDLDGDSAYTLDIRSKLFQLPVTASNVAQLHIVYTPIRVGAIDISYSKDNGETYVLYKTVTFGATDIGKRITKVCNKNVRSNSFMWRLTQTVGLADIIEYKAYVFQVAGYLRQNG